MLLWPSNDWLAHLLAECATLPTLSLPMLGLGEGLRHGEFAGQLLETGVDVEESRVYLPGDSVRHINWRLTARSDQVFVKYQAKPTEMRARLIVDLRASAWQGTCERLKAEQMVRVAFYMAQQLAKVMVVDTQVWSHDAPVLPILRGSGRWFYWSEAWQPLLVSLSMTAQSESLPLAEALLNLNAQTCVLVSDLSDWDSQLESQLLEVRLRGPVVLVHVLDRHEVQLPVVSDVLLGAHGFSVQSTTVAAYHHAMRAYLATIQDWCAAMSVQYLPLWADAELAQLTMQSDWSS